LRSALARALAATVLVSLLAAQATACGGDEERVPSTVPARPELTVPGEKARPAEAAGGRERRSTSATEPAPPPPTTDQAPSSTAEAPSTTQPPADSPSNDTPPPSGSAADRFEQACRENPDACR